MKKIIAIVMVLACVCGVAMFATSCSKHEHTIVIDEAVQATCTETGLTEGQHCSECNEVIVAQEVVEKTKHTVVTVDGIAPTCNETGLTDGSYCSVCNEILSSQTTIPQVDHDYQPTPKIEPSCTQEGREESVVCTFCNKVFKEGKIIGKIEHTIVIDKEIPATCTEEGLTEGKHCSVCNTIIVEQETIPTIDHKIVKDKAVPATCTSTGLTEGAHCTVCNAITMVQKTINKVNHNLNTVAAVEPTCKSEGKTEGSYCTSCNTMIVEQKTINKVDHKYKTTYDNTNHTSTCVFCGKSNTEKHNIDTSGKCTCGYIETNNPAEEHLVVSIAKNNVSVYNDMTDYSKVDQTKYMELSGFNGWAPTKNGNCNTRVKDISWLNVNGFAIIEVNSDETKINKSYIALYSNTIDTDYLKPNIERGLAELNTVYGNMYNETINALDTFLSSIGTYKEIDFIKKENGSYVSKGSVNAVSNFKSIVSDICTFETTDRPVPVQKYRFESKLTIETEEYRYTITVSQKFSFKNSKAQSVSITIQGENLSHIINDGEINIIQ